MNPGIKIPATGYQTVACNMEICETNQSIMKKLTVLALTLSVLMYSCEKSDTNDLPGNSSTVSFKTDGTEIVADSAHAVLYTLGIAPFNRMIDVFAYKAGVEVLEFHFKPSTGNHVADGTFSNAWLTYKTGSIFPNDYYHSTSGTLTLTLCDTVAKRIEGSFNFTGNNGSSNSSITAGNMKLNITEVF